MTDSPAENSLDDAVRSYAAEAHPGQIVEYPCLTRQALEGDQK